jgi:preprotein translocase subunit YajC
VHDQILQAASNKSGSSLTGLIFPLLIVALLFLFLSQQRRRQRAQAQTRASIGPGAEVVTTAGLYATVVETDDDGVLLEIAPGVVCRYAPNAIARVVAGPEDDGGGSEDEHDGAADETDTTGVNGVTAEAAGTAGTAPAAGDTPPRLTKGKGGDSAEPAEKVDGNGEERPG